MRSNVLHKRSRHGKPCRPAYAGVRQHPAHVNKLENDMTDGELLEAAAKAAGYAIESYNADGSCWACVDAAPMNSDGEPPIFKWHPRDDDGDALRLAVRLRISLDMLTHIVDATTGTVMCHEPWGDDHNAATRRAIFRAAAAMVAR